MQSLVLLSTWTGNINGVVQRAPIVMGDIGTLVSRGKLKEEVYNWESEYVPTEHRYPKAEDDHCDRNVNE
ncbi:hypothetical protein PAHA111176_15660 [Parendozoicomonas haliclonae]|uniref:Uncharacterized protein n=1 Tax=Parendozoicomonas haliclonae TaxID=1960125 RepID=A0A1X7AJE6_9GAMM|nr:hypothetical protein EHSB41UT_01252 [Parendozoicomonas haliclonae]